MKNMLDYLTSIKISDNTMQHVHPEDNIEPTPHLHNGWEIKILRDRMLVVPANCVHSATPAKDIIGGVLFDKNDITLGFRNDIPVCIPRKINKFPYEKLLEVHSALPHTESVCKTELTGVFFRMIIKDITSTPAAATELDLIGTIQYLLKNYYNLPDFNISVLAEKMGYSQQYLNRKYKKSFGRTIQQELVRIRLDYADGLLRSGKYFVTEVAQLTGWSSVYYFSNVYKKHYGFAPTAAINDKNRKQ